MNSGHVVAWPSLTTSLAVGAENAWAVYRRNVGERNALSKTPHACCHKFVGRCRPSVHECWICLKFTPTSFVHFCSALFGPENHLSTILVLFFSFLLSLFFSPVSILLRILTIKLPKLVESTLTPKKKTHRISKIFTNFFVEKWRDLARERKHHLGGLFWSGLLSVRWFAWGSGPAAALLFWCWLCITRKLY